MKTTYAPSNIALPDDALREVASDCAREVLFCSASALIPLALSKVVGEKAANALRKAVDVVLDKAGLVGMTVQEWHLVCAQQLPSKSSLMRDVTDQKAVQAFCVLLSLDGAGLLSLSKPSPEEKPTMKMQQVRLNRGDCIVYQCNVTYTIQQTSSMYLHCVCARDCAAPRVTVLQQIRFPCPYNKTQMIGDVRAYPKDYDPDCTVACMYRGGRWPNVLDHLMYCKAIPVTEKSLAARERRAARNTSDEQYFCDFCDVPPFTKKNTFHQHRRRNHPVEAGRATNLTSSLASVDYSLSSVLDLSTPRDEVDVEEFGWLYSSEPPFGIDVEHSQAKKRKKLHRRRSSWVGSVPTTEQTNSVLMQFDMCLETLGNDDTDDSLPEQEAVDQVVLDMTVMNTAGVFALDSTGAESPSDRCALEPLEVAESYKAVTDMLSRITRSNIRQPAGRMGLNAGEMSLVGVTAVLNAFGRISPDDVFADIGSGIGNVSIQVAVQSRFAQSVCIEMRPELTALTTRIIADNLSTEPRLGKLEVITVDITEVDLVDIDSMAKVSHIFSHNTVFDPNAMLKFEDMCFLPKLRYIALTRLPCTRHRDRCTNLFCQAWKLMSTVHTPVTYKDGLVEVFIFSKSDHLM